MHNVNSGTKGGNNYVYLLVLHRVIYCHHHHMSPLVEYKTCQCTGDERGRERFSSLCSLPTCTKTSEAWWQKKHNICEHTKDFYCCLPPQYWNIVLVGFYSNSWETYRVFFPLCVYVCVRRRERERLIHIIIYQVCTCAMLKGLKWLISQPTNHYWCWFSIFSCFLQQINLIYHDNLPSWPWFLGTWFHWSTTLFLQQAVILWVRPEQQG